MYTSEDRGKVRGRKKIHLMESSLGKNEHGSLRDYENKNVNTELTQQIYRQQDQLEDPNNNFRY